jgi:hypothetical protein
MRGSLTVNSRLFALQLTTSLSTSGLQGRFLTATQILGAFDIFLRRKKTEHFFVLKENNDFTFFTLDKKFG